MKRIQLMATPLYNGTGYGMEGSARKALSAGLLALLLGMALEGAAGTGVAEGHAQQKSACIFDHVMLRTPPGQCRPRARSYPRKVVGKVRRSIYDAALTFGVPYEVLLRIAACESGLNPQANSPGYYGLFQFAPDTFLRGTRQMRRDTGITASSYWKPLDASYVAGFLFAVGESPRWSCQ